MRREFCDRCGTEGMSKQERKAAQWGQKQAGVKVVRVTMVPLARVMDLCGACRKDLDAALDTFIDPAAPVLAATPKSGGAFPEGNDGDAGAAG